ncbi:MAG: tRNA (adenosine(37)-N6)-dimethylallyltransferase MiaA [Rickettsiales bacterium]|nr:tRNA (adenosine(37)-N6)-dimethylallyltransferase MiaA [Rickettsiales bacterium]
MYCESRNKKIVIISGPTVSGKTAYSINLAKEQNGIVINVDSMQIYKGLPILSAQPKESEKKDIEHLLFSHLEPENNCNIGLWLNLAKEKIDYCFLKGKTPIVVGGTGMYISKLIDGISQIPEVPQEIREKINNLYEEIGYQECYEKALKIDKEYIEKLNPNDKQRMLRLLEIFEVSGKSIRYFQEKGNIAFFPREMFFHININPLRDILYQRCELRFKKLVEKDNVLEEIKTFSQNHKNIISNQNNYSVSNTIGLAEGIKYLNGEISLEEFINQSVKITRNYAKRQYTWFNHQFDKFDLQIE